MLLALFCAKTITTNQLHGMQQYMGYIIDGILYMVLGALNF